MSLKQAMEQFERDSEQARLQGEAADRRTQQGYQPIHRIFVYGSLMTGLHNHRLIAGQWFIREAVTEPVYLLHDLGSFPGLVYHGAGGDAVRGELWEVGDEVMARLDMLEGRPHLYDREPAYLVGEKMALVYIYQRGADGYDVVESGDWRRHLEEKRKKDLHPANRAV